MLKTFEEKLGFFPYGTQYHRAPTPLPEEWAGDLANIAGAGYTHVQLRPQWRCHERIRGKTIWDDLDRLFELADRNLLRVILKPMLETAPDWVYTELGGTRKGFHGVPISPVAEGAFYVGGWLPCFDNPFVMEAALEFVGQLVARYRAHPAFWFYNAWNEPRSRPMSQCQCEHSVTSYRCWLREKFRCIESLNEHFGKAWTSFDTVMPPTFTGDYVEMYLWRQWAAAAVAEHVGKVNDLIKQLDPSAFVMCHTGCCSVVQDAAADTCDDILVASRVDRYGTSMPVYPWPETPLAHDEADFISDWLRRVDKNFWCQEFYPSRANWTKPQEPKVLTRQIWSTIAAGANGFTFWQYRSERLGQESNGWGMREINGEATPRSLACDDVARTIKNMGPRLAGTAVAKARVGLLYSRESDLLGSIQETPNFISNISCNNSGVHYSYKRALKAAHCLYQANGEAVDFVVPGDDLEGISILHVVGAEIIDSSTAEWLEKFVAGGGCLVTEFPFACRDANTWVSPYRPNHKLGNLLGLKEHFRVIIEADAPQHVVFKGDNSLEARGWRVEFTPLNGETIARWDDGSAAAVKNRYGAGMVYSLGASPSLSFGDSWKDAAIDVFSWILKDNGLSLNQWSNRRVRVRRRHGNGYDIWFVFNLSDRPEQIALPEMPTNVWTCGEATVDNRTLTLLSGETWVAEIPCVTMTDKGASRVKKDEHEDRDRQKKSHTFVHAG